MMYQNRRLYKNSSRKNGQALGVFFKDFWFHIKKCSIDGEFPFEKKMISPTPGIEPGPPGWKLGILAIRPRGIVDNN